MPTSPTSPSTSVLFVCLGNICRSPLAEGVFLHLVEERGLEGRFIVDSAGTGAWHVGEHPDGRSAEVAGRHGIALVSRARQVTPDDLDRFDLIVAMDQDNLRDLERLVDGRPARATLHLLREFDPGADDDAEVPDPYYGGPRGFDVVYDMVRRSCAALLTHLDEDGRGS